MRAVIQVVSQAEVEVGNQVVGTISKACNSSAFQNDDSDQAFIYASSGLKFFGFQKKNQFIRAISETCVLVSSLYSNWII